MGRVILLVLSLVLSVSVATGAVAHAIEGAPLETSYAIDNCADAAQSSSQDDGEDVPHSHICHGHHVGVPLPAVESPIASVHRYLHRAPVNQSLSSVRLRTPQEPPRA